MQILKKLFIDKKLNLFTSKIDLHRHSRVKLFEAPEDSTNWVIHHELPCTEIVTQIFTLNDKEEYEVGYPQSVIHDNGRTEISLFSPTRGIVLLVCTDIKRPPL